MKDENRNILETKYRPKLKLWINDQTCHLGVDEKQQILNIIHEEFDPYYHVDLYCGSCVVKMLEYVFKRTDELITITVPLNDSFTAINPKKKK